MVDFIIFLPIMAGTSALIGLWRIFHKPRSRKQRKQPQRRPQLRNRAARNLKYRSNCRRRRKYGKYPATYRKPRLPTILEERN
ncbi:hypothetical protein GGR51DRAFT_500523 [Nemania sp. FL0031]|nr:hypothetical protein GGR51DRAFT_500523 [Nemania sp. FL0031]